MLHPSREDKKGLEKAVIAGPLASYHATDRVDFEAAGGDAEHLAPDVLVDRAPVVTPRLVIRPFSRTRM
jgi:hypothetical protein